MFWGGGSIVTVPFNDLSRAVRAQHAQLAAATEEVLTSGWFINGPRVQAFERDFARYIGVPHVQGVASGTDALELALRSLKCDSRATVVTTANAGGYATCAAQAAGLRVQFADVEADSHCLDAADLARVLDGDTFAVVVTHLYGRLAGVASVRAVCESRGIAILEDCAQAAGAGTPGQRAGTLGDIATFSFYPTKNLGALGDGGAIATRSNDLAQRVSKFAQYGWEEKYRQVLSGGRNSRLDEIQAAYLSVRLPHLDAWNVRRRAIVAQYEQASNERVHVLPARDEMDVAHLAVAVTD